jgi:hypothetical protein
MVRTKTNRLLQHHARNAFSCLYSGYSLIVFPRVFLGSSTSFVLILFSFNDNMGDRFSRISNCIISVHPILCIRSCWRDACNSDSSSRSRLYRGVRNSAARCTRRQNRFLILASILKILASISKILASILKILESIFKTI